MRALPLLVGLLAMGVAQAGIVDSLISGTIEGAIKGAVFATAPVAKVGAGVAMNFVQWELRMGKKMLGSVFGSASPKMRAQVEATLGEMQMQQRSIIDQTTGATRAFIDQIRSLFTNGMTRIFGAFGALSTPQQRAIVSQLSNAEVAAASALKSRLQKVQAAPQEIEQLRHALESDHTSTRSLLATLHTKAPVLSETAKEMYEKAASEWQRDFKQLEPSAQRGVKMMHDSVTRSLHGIDAALSKLKPAQQKQLGSTHHLISNMARLVHIVV